MKDRMARKKSYSEVIAEHIARVVQDRGIQDVLHFTRLENLPSILEHGLRPRSELEEGYFKPSDADRLDENYEAVSVSISCFYPDMFAAKRHRSGGAPWAVLVLHADVLWNYHCSFYRRGVPTNVMKYDHSKKYGGFALEEMFEDAYMSQDKTSFRAQHALPQSWPTFSDAEVQVRGVIDPSYIKGVWIETHDSAEIARAALESAGRQDCGLAVQSFAPRICGKPYWWG
jgi:hypothetical protein